MSKFKLYFELLKMKGALFYMRYIKVIIMAIVEVIADLYDRRNDRRQLDKIKEFFTNI